MDLNQNVTPGKQIIAIQKVVRYSQEICQKVTKCIPGTVARGYWIIS
jgi:hypothetical protein